MTYFICAISDISPNRDLSKKEEDEFKALQLCQNKVRQKKLPMQVVDCEFQWLVHLFDTTRTCSSKFIGIDAS